MITQFFRSAISVKNNRNQKLYKNMVRDNRKFKKENAKIDFKNSFYLSTFSGFVVVAVLFVFLIICFKHKFCLDNCSRIGKKNPILSSPFVQLH